MNVYQIFGTLGDYTAVNVFQGSRSVILATPTWAVNATREQAAEILKAARRTGARINIERYD